MPLASALKPSFSKTVLPLCRGSCASNLLSSLAPDFASISLYYSSLGFSVPSSFLRLKCGNFHTSSKTSFWKNLKYGGNETNHIFTIDNTNVFKKKTFTIFYFQNLKLARLKPVSKSKALTCTLCSYDPKEAPNMISSHSDCFRALNAPFFLQPQISSFRI